MPSEIEVSKLVDDIYDAVGDADRWASVLRGLQILTHADAVLQLEVEARGKVLERAELVREDHVHGMDVASGRLCATLAPESPLAPLVIAAPPGAALAAYGMTDRTSFERTEIFQRWARPLALSDAYFSVLASPGPDAAVLSVLRARRASPAGYEKDLCGAEAVTPHLSRLHQLNGRLARAGVTTSLSAVLESLSAAALCLSACGRVLAMNASAERLLQAGDGLRREPDGRLVAVTPAGSRALQHMMVEVGRRRGAAAAVGRPSGRPPFLVTAAPIPREEESVVSSFLPNRARPKAIVVVSEPDAAWSTAQHLVLHRRLATLYGLTPAECLTADMIHGHHGLSVVAGLLGVSHSTVATHRRRIFQKMDVHTLAELACRVESISQLI